MEPPPRYGLLGQDWVWRIWIEPALREFRIAGIKPTDVQQLYGAMVSQGKKPATVQLVHHTLHSILRAAIADGLIRRDATEGRMLPATEREPTLVWSADEVATFLAATADDELGNLWAVLIATGMRVGEALALQWQDFDAHARTVRISKTLRTDATTRREVIGQNAKTRSSHRTVVLPAAAVMALHRQYGIQLRRSSNSVGEAALIFPHPRTGDPWRLSSVRDVFRRSARRAGVPVLRLHDLHHTAATLMATRNVSPKAVQEQLDMRGSV